MEIWKDIEGYEGLYQISNWGRVRSLKYKGGSKERILKPCISGRGYLYVSLCKNHKRKNHYIHRLVGKAFLDNPDNLNEINHKDEDKKNNHANNIEWCDRKYNCNYGTAIQRMTKTLSRTIYQYTLDGELLNEWQSMHEIQRKLGYDRRSISKCCRGLFKQSHGYKWTY